MAYSPNVDYRAVARRKAAKYGLDPRIFQRQIGVESVDYSPAVISGRESSPAGAQGIAQFMPGTARGLGVDPLRPVKALDAAAKLMAGYVKKYGSYRNALVAYNAGPGAVGGSLPGETQRYIQEILRGRDPGGLKKPQRTASGGPRVKAPGPAAAAPGGAVTSDTGLASLISQLVGQRPTVAISAPQLPSFAAHPTLPAGFVPTMAAWSPSSSPSTASLVDAIQQTSTSAGVPRAAAPAKVAGAARSVAAARGVRGVPLRPHGRWNGTSGPLYALFQRFGKPLGLQVTSTKRHNTNPYSGSRSDHDVGNRSAYAIDASNGSAPTAQMDEYAYNVMHALGFKGYRKGQPINVSQGVRTIHGLQFQVIYRGNGPEFGGNHLTHVHVGVHRV